MIKISEKDSTMTDSAKTYMNTRRKSRVGSIFSVVRPSRGSMVMGPAAAEAARRALLQGRGGSSGRLDLFRGVSSGGRSDVGLNGALQRNCSIGFGTFPFSFPFIFIPLTYLCSSWCSLQIQLADLYSTTRRMKVYLGDGLMWKAMRSTARITGTK